MTTDPTGAQRDPDTLAGFLNLESPQAIAEALARRTSYQDGPIGRTAQTACVVLASREVERTLRAIENRAKALEAWALAIGSLSLLVSVTALIVAIVSAR